MLLTLNFVEKCKRSTLKTKTSSNKNQKLLRWSSTISASITLHLRSACLALFQLPRHYQLQTSISSSSRIENRRNRTSSMNWLTPFFQSLGRLPASSFIQQKFQSSNSLSILLSSTTTLHLTSYFHQANNKIFPFSLNSTYLSTPITTSLTLESFRPVTCPTLSTINQRSESSTSFSSTFLLLLS